LKPFWLTRLCGCKRIEERRELAYVVLSLVLSTIAVTADNLVPTFVLDSSPWWSKFRSMSAVDNVFFFLTLISGFLLPYRLYSYLIDHVLPDMVKKAEKTPQSKKIKSTLKMFTLVAGGSALYQGICILVTLLLFVGLQTFYLFPLWRETLGLPRVFDITPFLSSWSNMLFYILLAIVGPMSTAIAGFVIYCGKKFRNMDLFDPAAKDRRGGFGSLGTLVARSSKMAFLVPGIAIIPTIVFPTLSGRPMLIHDVSLSVGLLTYFVFCVASFFFIPTYFAHLAMRDSRELAIIRYEYAYRSKLEELQETLKYGKTSGKIVLPIIALRAIHHDIVESSDWPLDYSTIMGFLATASPFLINLVRLVLALANISPMLP